MRVTDIRIRKHWHLALAIVVGFALTAAAAPVGVEDAGLVAASYLLGETRPAYPMSEATRDVKGIREIADPENGRTLAYVYEFEPTGYLIVGPDTSLPPIIAHSETGVFSWDETASNVLLDLVRADLSARLEALEDGAIAKESRRDAEAAWTAVRRGTSRPTSDSAAEIIGPLIEATTWSQAAPWNESVPVDPSTGKQSLVGCVATALAQLVSYWGYPATVLFSPSSSYTTTTKGIQIQAEEASISRIEYPAKDFYNPSDEMMAALSYAAGVSVGMDYTSQGSGAYTIDLAYALAGGATPVARRIEPDVWRYESAEIRTYVLMGWGVPFVQDQSAFYRDIRDDLSEGAPVVLNVVSTSSRMGHTLICDGYDGETGRYHLNMGWGGQMDGWYALPEDIPPGYNIVESGVLNIRPGKASDTDWHDSHGNTSIPSESQVSVVVGPIPMENSVRFEVEDDLVDVMTIHIADTAGNIVWQVTLYDQNQAWWDGHTSSGERLANGPYIYVIAGAAGGETFKQRGVLFVRR